MVSVVFCIALQGSMLPLHDALNGHISKKACRVVKQYRLSIRILLIRSGGADKVGLGLSFARASTLV